MPCCNRRRALLAAGSPGLATGRTPSPARGLPETDLSGTDQPAAGGIRLHFTGSRRVRVEGVVSGRVYHASPTAPVITASPQDVRSLLRSGLFTRIAPG